MFGTKFWNIEFGVTPMMGPKTTMMVVTISILLKHTKRR